MLIERVPNDNIPRTKRHKTHYALDVLTGLTAEFGSVHAIAWNFEFPTFTERLLWRVATLISTAIPPLALFLVPLAQIIVPWGHSSDFRYACLDVMREYSWSAKDNRQVQKAMKNLLELYDDNSQGAQHKHYSDILGESANHLEKSHKDYVKGSKGAEEPKERGGFEGSEEFVGDSDERFQTSSSNIYVSEEVSKGLNFKALGDRLLEYIHGDPGFKKRLPDDFLLKFTQLVDIIKGSRSKRLWGAARTDIYPRRSVLSPRVNDGIIYITSAIYCLARITIISLAFSSLRLMPNSVYTIL